MTRLCAFTIFMSLTLTAWAGPAQRVTTIKEIRTGWNRDQFAIVTNESPMVDPAGCGNNDGYATDSSQPGYQTYYAAAITAFVEHAQIVAVIDDTPHSCVAGRPKLIGINVRR